MSRVSAVILFMVSTPALAVTTTGPGLPIVPKAEEQPVYKSVWRDDGKGDLVNLQSGLRCDAWVGDYRRINVHTYSPFGLDISCNYLSAKGSFITIYLTQRHGQSLADDMAEAKRELLNAHPDVSDMAEPPQAAESSGADMQRAFYSREGGQIREGIWIGDLGGWTLEYRVTYVPGEEADALAETATLTAAAQKSAGAQLELCSKAPPPQRDGTPLTDEKEIQSSLFEQAIIVGAGADDKLKDIARPRPLTWCAESIIGPKEASFLLWHGVYDDGSDASADRVTPATVGEPPLLTSAPDASLAQILAEIAKSAPAKSRWTVSLTDGEQTWIFAFYEGRPGTDDLAKIAAEVAAHKARSLGGYNIKGKKITITVPDKTP